MYTSITLNLQGLLQSRVTLDRTFLIKGAAYLPKQTTFKPLHYSSRESIRRNNQPKSELEEAYEKRRRHHES